MMIAWDQSQENQDSNRRNPDLKSDDDFQLGTYILPAVTVHYYSILTTTVWKCGKTEHQKSMAVTPSMKALSASCDDGDPQ